MAETQRLDVWLDTSCLFRTRSEAKRACEGGKTEVNGQRARPNRMLRVGDHIHITRPFGRQDVVVMGFAEGNVTRVQARDLYEDRTPKPSPAEIEARRQERVYRAAARAAGPPGRRQRRAARRLKEGR